MEIKNVINKFSIIFLLSFLLISVVIALPDNTPVMHWTFNYTTPYIDQTGNNRDGSLIGGHTNVSGAVDGAKDFLLGEGVLANYGSGVDPNDRTYSFWVSKTSNWSYPTPIGQWGQPVHAAWKLGFYEDNIRVLAHDKTTELNGYVEFNVSSNYTLDTWYHIVVYLNETNTKVWSDGQYLGQGTFTNSVVINDVPDANYEVASDDTDVEFIGSIDDLRIYEGELNSSEILGLYGLGEFGLPPTITLQTDDRYRTFDNTPTFYFTPYADNSTDLMDCTLYVNDTLMGTLVNISNGTLSSLTPVTNLSRDAHLWYVNCTDGVFNTKSEERTIIILKEPILNNVEIINSDYYINTFDDGTGAGQVISELKNITISNLDSVIAARFELTGVSTPANNVTGDDLNVYESSSSCVGTGCGDNLPIAKTWVDSGIGNYEWFGGIDHDDTNVTYEYVLTLPNSSINSIGLKYSIFALNALGYNFNSTYGLNMNTYIYNRTSTLWDAINIYKKTGETWMICNVVDETIDLSNDYKNDNLEIILKFNWAWLDPNPNIIGNSQTCDGVVVPSSSQTLINFNYTFNYDFFPTNVSVQIGGVDVEIENSGVGGVDLYDDTYTVEFRDELNNCLGAGGTCNLTINKDGLRGEITVDNLHIYYNTTEPEVYYTIDDIYCGTDGSYIDTYYYTWQVNSVNVTGEDTHLLDSSNFVRNDNVGCFVYGETNPITPLLNDNIVITNTPPIINQIYVTPTYPDPNDNLVCNFNVTDGDADDINASVTWHKIDVDRLSQFQEDGNATGVTTGFYVDDYYVNYTKFDNIVSAKWYVKAGWNQTLNTAIPPRYFDVPVSCFDEFSDRVNFRINGDSGNPTHGVTLYCWNGGWENMWSYSVTCSGGQDGADGTAFLYDGDYDTYACAGSGKWTSQCNACSFYSRVYEEAIVWSYNNVTRTDVHTYDTTFVNVTQDVLFQTSVGNGTVTEVLQNYSQWYCELDVGDPANTTAQNSSTVDVFPLENLTLIFPLNNIISDQKLNVVANVIDDNEGIICDLYGDSVVIANSTPLSRIDFSTVNNSYPVTDGEYDWYLSCTANGNPTPLVSEERVYRYDITPPDITNLYMFQSVYYPQIGDLVEFNATVTDVIYIDTCKLALNDTDGVYVNKSTLFVDANYTADISFTYEITENSTANNSNVGWKVWCNDSIGHTVESLIQTFIVRDVELPVVDISSTSNGFSADNRTIVAPHIQNLTLNLTFFDFNLFQGLVNITCEDAGQIYYWEELDFNVTTYVHEDEVDLTGLGLQKCNVFISSSDDHTAKETPKYKETKKSTGYDYETELGTFISIDSKEDVSNIESLESHKLVDRHIFGFKFKDKGLLREFQIEADKNIYQRNSEYQGHIVVWDEDANAGNWFDLENDVNTIVTLEKQNKNLYNAYIYPDIPVSEIQFKSPQQEPDWNDEDDVVQFYKNIESKVDNFGYLQIMYGIDELNFESLGGTNVNNATYAFYLGGAVNVTGFNLYDNSTFGNYSLTVTVLNSFPAENQTFVNLPESTWIANLSNGTYEFAFTDPEGRFFPKSYDVNITGPAQNRTYYTVQSEIRIQLRNVATGVLLDNLNLTITNTDTSQVDFNATGDTTVGEFYLDEGVYEMLGQREDYDDYVENFTVDYLDNRTIIFDMSFLATFNLLDEKTLGPFNVSGADSIEFLLFCEDSTFTTTINESVAVIPITCDYLKFKFVLTYGTTNYYRTFILDPDDAFDVDVYLIDKLTTQDVFNSFIIDDLLGDYENPRIFVKKIINEQTIQITADYVDIENKIGAYLIENNEYIIEVHSDNQPIRIMGIYSAAFSGDKVLRLYEIDLESSPASFSSSVTYSAGIQEIDDTNHIVAYYDDTENVTTSVTFNVYQDNYQGTLIYTTSNITSPTIEFDWDLNGTGYENDTLVVQMIIDHQDGIYNYVKVVQDIQTITADILDFVSPGFLNWFFLILLGVLAIFATIRTANIVSMALIGFASLFVMFGWFGLSSGILALSAFISLLSILKEGEKLGG